MLPGLGEPSSSYRGSRFPRYHERSVKMNNDPGPLRVHINEGLLYMDFLESTSLLHDY